MRNVQFKASRAAICIIRTGSLIFREAIKNLREKILERREFIRDLNPLASIRLETLREEARGLNRISLTDSKMRLVIIEGGMISR